MFNLNRSQFILGTTQFGKKYGVTNFTPKLSNKKILDLFLLAWKNQIQRFDTAPSYKTEKILGEFIKAHGIQKEVKISTKISSIKGKNLESFVRRSIEDSMKLLTTKIDTLFFHDPKDIEKLVKNKGFLNKIIKDYNLKNLGFSIYSSSEKKKISKLPFKPAIQYPISVANQSFQHKNFGINKNFARSIFLQGLLINSKFKKNNLPKRLINSVQMYHHQLKLHNINAIELALFYVSSIKNIDFFLVGVDNVDQLKKIIFCNINKVIDKKFIKKINLLFNQKDVDPRSW